MLKPKNEALEDDYFPFQKGDFEVPLVSFLGRTVCGVFPLVLLGGSSKPHPEVVGSLNKDHEVGMVAYPNDPVSYDMFDHVPRCVALHGQLIVMANCLEVSAIFNVCVISTPMVWVVIDCPQASPCVVYMFFQVWLIWLRGSNHKSESSVSTGADQQSSSATDDNVIEKNCLPTNIN